MPRPDTIPVWGTNTGSTVIAALNIDTIANQSAGRQRYTFSGSPDLSSVVVGHQLEVSGTTNDANAGTFSILAKDNSAKWIEVLNAAIVDATEDETGSPGTANVLSNSSLIQAPSLAKRLLGWIAREYPPANWLNWWMNLVGQWVDYFANGGALVLRNSLDAWRDVDRTDASEGNEVVKGNGLYRYDPDATDTPGEGFLEPDTGGGLGIIEAPHPDAMAAMLAAFVPEILPPVQAVLNFDSVSAGAVGTPLTVTVPGAVVKDQVILGPPSGIDTGLMWAGFVSAADTVQIRLFNGTGSPINPAEATWSVTVVRPNSMPVITTRGLKIFVNLIGGVYDSTSLEADLGIADNEAAFNLLVNSRQHRAALLDGGTIEAIISGSATADAIILATGGY